MEAQEKADQTSNEKEATEKKIEEQNTLMDNEVSKKAEGEVIENGSHVGKAGDSEPQVTMQINLVQVPLDDCSVTVAL